jgi:hypothetical protein
MGLTFSKKQKITSAIYEEFKKQRGDKPKDENFDYDYACFLENKIAEMSGVGEPLTTRKNSLHKHIVMPRFSSKEELREFIQLHFPIAIKPKKPAKTMFISPVTSANAQKVIIDCLVDAFLNGA